MRSIVHIGTGCLFVLVGCEDRRSVDLTADRWQVGDTIWLHVNHLDSVLSPDSNFVRKNTSTSVRFCVLATAPVPRIEWQEFGLMPAIDSAGIRLAEEQWFPSTRLVYDCHPDGSVDALVNYDELAASMDTLLGMYLAQVDGLTSAQDSLVRSMMTDSAWIAATYLSDIDLYHQFFGIQLTGTADDKALVHLPELFPEPVEFNITLVSDPICDPNTQVSIAGTIRSDSLPLKSLFDQVPAFGRLTGTIASFDGISSGITVDLSLCFDTARSVPALVTQRARVTVPGAVVLRTTQIYVDERWTRSP